MNHLKIFPFHYKTIKFEFSLKKINLRFLLKLFLNWKQNILKWTLLFWMIGLQYMWEFPKSKLCFELITPLAHHITFSINKRKLSSFKLSIFFLMYSQILFHRENENIVIFISRLVSHVTCSSFLLFSFLSRA